MKHLMILLLISAFAFSCHAPHPGEDYYNAGMKKLELEKPYPANNVALYQSALGDLKKAIDENPNYADAFEQSAKVKLALEDFAGGIADAKEAMRIEPKKSSKMYSLIGDIAFVQKDYMSSVKSNTQAIAFDNNFSHAYYMRAMAEKALNDKVDAMRDFTKNIEILGLNSKESKYLYALRAHLKLDMNDKNGACADFHKALELGSENAQKEIDENCK